MPRKLAAGNWKMNGTGSALAELELLAPIATTAACDVLICPPATLISRARDTAADAISIGAQDCHSETSGAHTGDLSADMLKDAGASHIIVGHSERRADHDEHDGIVRSKARAAIAQGLVAIVCVGEELHEREVGNTLEIIGGQLAGSLPDDITADSLVVAYEPIWAIGTGKVPSLQEIGEVHDFIRTKLQARYGEDTGSNISLLYGGSVKPGNAAEIFQAENVNGALVGGASLKATDFGPIIDALGAS